MGRLPHPGWSYDTLHIAFLAISPVWTVLRGVRQLIRVTDQAWWVQSTHPRQGYSLTFLYDQRKSNLLPPDHHRRFKSRFCPKPYFEKWWWPTIPRTGGRLYQEIWIWGPGTSRDCGDRCIKGNDFLTCTRLCPQCRCPEGFSKSFSCHLVSHFWIHTSHLSLVKHSKPDPPKT